MSTTPRTTPRTDAELLRTPSLTYLARTLEIELNAMQARAEKAEAALAKAKATIEDICTGGRLTCDQCLETMPCNCGHSLRRP
jgi:hypothetical protein